MNLTDLFQQNGKVMEVEIPVTEEIFAKDSFMNDFSVEDSFVRLNFRNIEKGKVLVEGRGEIPYSSSCNRCLENVKGKIILDFEEHLYSPEVEIDEDTKEEQYYLEGYELDLLTLLREEVQLALPTKILCKEDCKGICKKCGCDLNTSSCQCDDFVPDVRFANLMEIFNNSQ